MADTLGPSPNDAAETVRTLERVGGQVDSVLDAVASLPVVPSYDSEDGLDATFGRLADTFEELPGQLEATPVSLTDFTDDAGELQAEFDRFADAVSTIAADLGDTDILVEQYRTSVADARALALDTKNDLDLDLSVTLMRMLLVVGGITLLLGQVVPPWLG